MISNKKSYAMKMFHLALALSLLHVDPDYLLRRWDRDSQLELSHHGDGNWELEMLRTVPMIETQHPYGNRKDIHPRLRIEDFLPFYEIGDNDGRAGEGKLPTIFNASALVMNLHNTTGNSSIQDMQSTSGGGATGNAVVGGSNAGSNGGGVATGGSSTGTTLGELHIDTTTRSNGHNHSYNLLAGGSTFGDQASFPPSVNQETRSIWEQNLADLLDFNDLPPLASPYANLPLKDGQQQSPNNTQLDLSLAALLHGFAGGLTTTEASNALNDSTPHPSNVGSSIVEQFGPDGSEDDDDDDDLLLGRLFREDCDGNNKDDSDVDRAIVCGIANACAVEGLTSNEPFINEVEVSNETNEDKVEEEKDKEEEEEEEESEIAEVLYKQDVDLGFSLDQEKIINASFASGNSAGTDAIKANLDSGKPMADPSNPSNTNDADKNDNDDDIEKLKALEELQQEDMNKINEKDSNPLSDITDEWNGIPFTIDNETGEYIRLPLDDLLNDVLKLSEFPLEDELPDDSIASTSQAAAAAALQGNQGQKSQKQSRIVSETGEDLLDDSGNVLVSSSQRDLNRNNNNNNGGPTPTITGDIDENSFSVSDFDDLQNSVGSPLFDLDEDAKKELDEMLQSTASPYPHHPHPHSHHHAAHPHTHHHHAHAHAHHAAAAAAAHQRAVQANYPSVSVGSGTASAFQRQPTAGGFHHGHHQSRMPRLNRSVSMERLQDFATYFSPIPNMDMPPYPHYPSYSYQSPTSGAPTAQHPSAQYGHGGALQPPPPPPPHHHGHHAAAAAAMLHPNSTLGDICPTGQPHYGHNLGSAVSSSMHLTNSSHHEADAGAAAVAAAGNAYKMEHDIMYYGNTSSDINQTDGFMNSIFTDEDLHLMDMNESFCRMVDNSTSNNSSVLGLPSGGHGNTALAAVGNHPNAANGNGNVGGVASMSTGGSAVGATSGMTTDLLANGGGAGAQGGGSADRLDSSSDSAVSSMGSERVPSLSDGEWGEGSDSAQDYHQGKYGGPYDFSYNNTRISTATRQPPVAQKKHQLYGKRDPHKQTPSALPPTVPPVAATAQNIKYEYDPGYAGMTNGGPGAVASLQHNGAEAGAMGPAISKEFHHQPYGMGASGSFPGDYTSRPSPRTTQDIVQLNHTYSLPQGSGSVPRPQARDKKPLTATKNSSKGAAAATGGSAMEDEHLTRDEKRARSINIPIPVTEIINLPMDEFNERLSKYDLNENQLSLIRDIRRRGKNKVAAQNCRKRKLDQILTLEDEVHAVVKRKAQLNNDRDQLDAERKRISNKFAMLHRHVFQYLRDPDGNPCSPADYSLQQAADGSVYLLPRDKSDSNSTTTTASSSVSATGGPTTASGGSGMNGHVPPQAPLHNHHAQHLQGQVQHVGNAAMSQQQTRLPTHLQQQQAPHHHHHQQGHPQQSVQQQQQQQQQQQHHKE